LVSLLGTKDKIDLFMQSGVLDSLTKLFKNSADDNIKIEVTKVFIELCNSSADCSRELSNRGVTILAREELIKRTRGVKLLSDFVVELLKLIRSILESDDELIGIDFGKNTFIKSILVCLVSGKRLAKIEAACCLCGIFLKFSKLDYDSSTFITLIDSLKKAIEEQDDELAALCLGAASYYGRYRKHFDFLRNLNGFMGIVLNCIGVEPIAVDKKFFAKYCQSPVIHLIKQLSDSPLQQEKFTNEGLFISIVSALQSELPETRADALELITSYISKSSDTSTLTMILRHILPLLSDKDERVLLKGAKCLHTMAIIPELINPIVDGQGVNALMNMLTSPRKDLVAAAGNAIAQLMESESARDVFVKSDGLLLIFSFIVSILKTL